MLIRTENDLKQFYEQHYKSAVQQAFRIVDSLHEAEDVVQECVVKLWHKRDELASKDNLLYYFKRMVRNQCIDHLRKKISHNETSDSLEIADEHHDHMSFNELSQNINDIIDSLPEKCRQIFVLSRFENMSYKEISAQLNIAPKTVETQISRALKVLRKGLGDQLYLLFL